VRLRISTTEFRLSSSYMYRSSGERWPNSPRIKATRQRIRQDIARDLEEARRKTPIELPGPPVRSTQRVPGDMVEDEAMPARGCWRIDRSEPCGLKVGIRCSARERSCRLCLPSLPDPFLTGASTNDRRRAGRRRLGGRERPGLAAVASHRWPAVAAVVGSRRSLAAHALPVVSHRRCRRDGKIRCDDAVWATCCGGESSTLAGRRAVTRPGCAFRLAPQPGRIGHPVTVSVRCWNGAEMARRARKPPLSCARRRRHALVERPRTTAVAPLLVIAPDLSVTATAASDTYPVQAWADEVIA